MTIVPEGGGTTLTMGERSTELLEREHVLAAMAASLADVREHQRGRLLLVPGEAGIGKTALLRSFCDEHRGAARISGARATHSSHPARSGR
jgi:hypothetical protein